MLPRGTLGSVYRSHRGLRFGPALFISALNDLFHEFSRSELPIEFYDDLGYVKTHPRYLCSSEIELRVAFWSWNHEKWSK